MKWLKKLMLFTLVILVIQTKKNNYNTKIKGLEKKTYITTQDFNKLTSGNVAAR